MSPGLLTGKIKAPPITSPSPTPTAYTNGHIPNGDNNNSIIKRGEEIAKTFLNSSDFKKLDSRIEDVVDISHMSSNTKLKTTTTTNTEETLTETKTYQTKPVANGSIGGQKKSIVDEDRNRKVVKASIADKKVLTKMDPAKDFGSFSALSTPGLLSGKPTSTSAVTTSNNNNEYEKLEEKAVEDASSSYKSSFLSRSSNEEELAATTKKTSEDYSSNKLFTTTISKTVKDNRSESLFGNSSSHVTGAEQSFVINTDPEVKSLKPVTGSKTFEPVSSPFTSYSSKSKETESRFTSVESNRPSLSSPLSSINEQEKKTSLGSSKAFTHHTIASASKINAIAPPREQSRSPVRSSRSKSPEIPSWATKDYSSTTTEVTNKKASFSAANSSTTAASSSIVKKSSSSISSRASPKRSMIPRRTSDAGAKAGETQNTSSPKGARNSKGKLFTVLLIYYLGNIIQRHFQNVK